VRNNLWFKRNDAVVVVYLALIVVAIAGVILNPVFIGPKNLGNLLEQSTALGIVSIGQAMAILVAGIDLSAGAVMSITSAVLATFISKGQPDIMLLPAILVVLLIGMLIGFINGLGITKLKLPPFVMTLGTMSIANGFALNILPQPGGYVPKVISTIFNTRITIIPIATFLWILLLVVAFIFLKRTRTGRNIYAVGGNEKTAVLTGISATKTNLVAYTLSGFMAALAGVYLVSRMYTGSPTAGTYFGLDSITVCVLGGFNLFGGRGNVVGLVAATFVLAALSNILNLAGLPPFYQYVLKGAILLITVFIFAIRNNRKSTVMES
jgi:ribose transport system permease protein